MVAALAVQLTFGLKNYLYSLFHTIIIYPKAYRSTQTNQMHKGESNPKLGVLVFSWEDFKEGISIENDNLNVGLHEFTHGLHFSFLKNNYGEAARFLKEYKKIIAACNPSLIKEMKEDPYIRAYAFVNAYELLSVLIECFFETPELLKERYAFIYAQLSSMLNLDPIKVNV